MDAFPLSITSIDNDGYGRAPARSVAKVMKSAQAYSPFLARLINRMPELVALLTEENWVEARQWVEDMPRHSPDIAVRLRRKRQALALYLGIGDLAGRMALGEIVGALSDFADEAVEMALTEAIHRRVPDAEAKGFFVLALGKHGSRELNYSSDIDPIFLYDPETLPRRHRDSPADSARHIAMHLVALLAEQTAESYVFRVDLRLRPAPEISPSALPIEHALTHYESSALAWEQAAFIRARVAAGDKGLGEQFLGSIRPFIWRRSLDYGQIGNIAEISHRIRSHYANGQQFGAGFDVKRGRGGIREIEFYAQMHQLIFGGRNADLRVSATEPALERLASASIIAEADARHLAATYRALRMVEHRVQMINDQQTHILPSTDEALDQLAALHGAANSRDFLHELAQFVGSSGEIYDRLIEGGEDRKERLPSDKEGLSSLLSQLADLQPETIALFTGQIIKWRKGGYRALSSSPARKAFESTLPSLLRMLATAPDPPRALIWFDRFLSQLPTALNFFHLLEARPALADLVGNILSHAPVLAAALAQRPQLLDGLIDATAFDLPPSVPLLIEQLAPIDEGADFQDRLNHVMTVVEERRFALGVQLVEARHKPLFIAHGHARVAEATVHFLTREVIKAFEAQYGGFVGNKLIILALGRMGGGELTHASDLDLIFLFTGDFRNQSNGPRSLGATQYFNRLAQRIVAALMQPTVNGALYDVDTRLRPSGKQGPMVVSVESFLEYQRNRAWTWEHMALTRARPLYGKASILTDLMGDIRAILADKYKEPDERHMLHDAVVNMRGDITAHKPPRGVLDIKLVEGGLVDAEFILHFLQLREGTALVPDMQEVANILQQEGHIPFAMVEALGFLTKLLIALRLMLPSCDIPPPVIQLAIVKSMGIEDWDMLIEAYEEARAVIKGVWRELLIGRPHSLL